MEKIFLNGPVQNGDFNLIDKPGKATGISIASSLNSILGTESTPHLWNSVMLSNDIAHRQATLHGENVSRARFELAKIAGKYEPEELNQTEIITDADPLVARFALNAVERALFEGRYDLSHEVVPICTSCGHMVGAEHSCRACGGEDISHERQRHLVAVRDPNRRILTRDNMYGYSNIRHLRAIAANVPERLVLSKTRAYGIDLGRIGLNGLVLDPRVGLHMTVLATAEMKGAESATMILTPKAASKIIAYGEEVRDLSDINFTYGLHGYIPYEGMSEPAGIYQEAGISESNKVLFEKWFLPLFSLKEKQGVHVDQIPELLRYFKRALGTSRHHKNKYPGGKNSLRRRVREGDHSWIMNKGLFSVALTESGVKDN
jgi:predicted RNA-binding Zn-ribbon protein involved in translation (DUF1610 family)